jgi:hypothetical protein
LNVYDLFRSVYDSDALKKNRVGKTVIKGEVREYKRGFTLREYAKWNKNL